MDTFKKEEHWIHGIFRKKENAEKELFLPDEISDGFYIIEMETKD